MERLRSLGYWSCWWLTSSSPSNTSPLVQCVGERGEGREGGGDEREEEREEEGRGRRRGEGGGGEREEEREGGGRGKRGGGERGTRRRKREGGGGEEREREEEGRRDRGSLMSHDLRDYWKELEADLHDVFTPASWSPHSAYKLHA